MTTPSTKDEREPGSLQRRGISVGQYYIRRSKRNIPRVVKVKTITADGKYCQVTYSCSGTKLHACLASELEADTTKLTDDEERASGVQHET